MKKLTHSRLVEIIREELHELTKSTATWRPTISKRTKKAQKDTGHYEKHHEKGKSDEPTGDDAVQYQYADDTPTSRIVHGQNPNVGYTAIDQAITTHAGKEPARNVTTQQTVSDTTKWIHPKSGQTTTLSKGQTQPAKGWSYRQATTTPGKIDTSKWIHPYKLKDPGTALSKGQTKPDFGWAYDTQARTGYTSPYEPSKEIKGQMRTYALKDPSKIAPTHGWTTPGKFLGQTQYHHGSKLQYDIVKGKKSAALPVKYNYGPKVKSYRHGGEAQYDFVKSLSDKGKGTWDGPGGRQSGLTPIKKTSNPKGPDITTYATQYGSGDDASYALSRKGVGRDQFSTADATTNPTTTQNVVSTNPNWTTWNAAKSRLVNIKTSAQSDPKLAYKYTPVDYGANAYGKSGGTATDLDNKEKPSDEYDDWKDTQDDFESKIEKSKEKHKTYQRMDKSRVLSIGSKGAAAKAYGSVAKKGKGKGKGKGEGEDDEWSSVKEGKLTEGFDLKKLEDAIRMFHKKIKKQGSITNARDEQHLKQLIKVYKDMGGRKIKEGGPGSGRPTKPGSKRDIEKKMDSAVDDANARLDAAEKAAKKKKKVKKEFILKDINKMIFENKNLYKKIKKDLTYGR